MLTLLAQADADKATAQAAATAAASRASADAGVQSQAVPAAPDSTHVVQQLQAQLEVRSSLPLTCCKCNSSCSTTVKDICGQPSEAPTLKHDKLQGGLAGMMAFVAGQCSNATVNTTAVLPVTLQVERARCQQAESDLANMVALIGGENDD